MVDTSEMLGDPALAIDPMDGNNLAMAMIHGAVDGGGPTVRSRIGLPFTTFTSNDAGATWDDAFYQSPQDLGNAYGEHSAAAVDPYGHVYVGSTYAVGERGGPFRYTIGAQKFDSVEQVRQKQTGADGSYNLVYVDPVFKGGKIRQTWFLFNAATDNMTMVWFEDRGNAPSGSATVPGDAPQADADSLDVLPGYAARRLAPPPHSSPPASSVAPRGTIGIVWTGVGDNDTYRRQPVEWSIGPCSGATNPVLFEGWLYVGCQADPKQGAFPWHPETQPGTVELFRMDPDGGKPVYMGASPIVGGAPKLGVRSDGRLALLSAGVSSANGLDLTGVFGHYSDGRIDWTGVHSYSDGVTPLARDERILRANIQDVLYREYSGVVHLILRETIEPVGIDAVQKSIGPKIRKCFVALDEDGVLAVHRLDIGNVLNKTDPFLNSQPEMAYEDLSDDIVQLPAAPFTYNGKDLGDTYQREFFAVGDYGEAIFAEVVEVTDLRFVPPVPVIAAAPGIPAAAASGTSSALGAVVGVTTGALLLAMIAAGRKTAVGSMAKMRK